MNWCTWAVKQDTQHSHDTLAYLLGSKLVTPEAVAKASLEVRNIPENKLQAFYNYSNELHNLLNTK